MDPLVSIVIPARNDAEALRRSVDHLQGLRAIQGSEIIVAASGEEKVTENAVRGLAKIVWPAQSTRAALMNAGASVASGDVLFFLHADSILHPDALVAIQSVLHDPGIVGGAFEHRFEESLWSLRLISWVNRRRYFFTRNLGSLSSLFQNRHSALRRALEYLRRANVSCPIDRKANRLLKAKDVEPPVINSLEVDRLMALAH